jgi:release factor glutamine methyltransferase
LEVDGLLALEHGYTQGAAVRALLAAAGFTGVATHHDLPGHERVTSGTAPQRTGPLDRSPAHSTPESAPIL